jgi:hypothetical protein
VKNKNTGKTLQAVLPTRRYTRHSHIPRQSRGVDKTVNRSKRIKTREPPKVAFTRTFSFGRISYRPLPGCAHMPVSSLHPDLPSIHNNRGPKSSALQNSACFPLPSQPISHSCLSHTQPPAIPSISAESRSPCAHDLPLASPGSLHSLSASTTPEALVPGRSEAAPITLSCGISESKPHDTCIPIWYGVSFRYVPFEASFCVTSSGSQSEAFLIFPQMSNFASPPAKPGVYPKS